METWATREVTLPARARGPCRVDEVQGRAAFAALRSEWDALLAGGPLDRPHHRHAFLGAWLDAFAPAARLRVLVARDRSGRAAGMAPFLEERRAGLAFWTAPANDHTPRFEWALGADARGAVDALWAHLRDRARWDVLVLRELPRYGPTSILVEACARRDRHPVGRWESQCVPFLALGGRPREERLSAKFVANLRRRLRRLQESGAVSYRRVGWGGPETPAEVERFVRQFLQLEAAGWKGARDTAIACDARAAAFYRGLADAAAREGWLALRALEVDGAPVAMHFGLVHRGAYEVPKLAYDEARGAFSPGQLLFREVLAEAEGRGLAELDLLGPDMPWKREWQPGFRQHDWLYAYRPGALGAALHATKHRLRPLLRTWLRPVARILPKEAFPWSAR